MKGSLESPTHRGECVAAASEGHFVAFEGSMQLYAELLNHRPPSGAWQVATAGCIGLAHLFARAQVTS